jgi:hypothetical protein
MENATPAKKLIAKRRPKWQKLAADAESVEELRKVADASKFCN